MSAVIAAPPVSRESKSALQLDLRPPPGTSAATIGAGSRPSPGYAAFPSSIQHFDLPKTEPGETEPGEGDRTSRSALGTGKLNFREMSPAETLARRIHQEGLPIARLWQSKSALLSIGLNQKGKPGLWLT
jgi:hypothetical protein